MTNWLKLNLNWQLWLFGYLVVTGLILALLIPPFQKPDEDYHFFQTYALVMGECNFLEQGNSMIMPKAVFELPSFLDQSQILNQPSSRFDFKKLNFNYRISSNQTAILNRPCMSSGWLGYWPQMIGVIIGGENILVSFYLARLIGLMIFLVAVFWAVKWSGRYWPIILTVAILPTTIHQVTAISSDSWHLSAGLLSFGAFLGIQQNLAKLSYQTWLRFLSLTLAFVLAKRGYYLGLGLPAITLGYLWLEPSLKKHLKLSVTASFLGICFIAAGIISISLTRLEKITTPIFQPDLQTEYSLSHKLEFVGLMIQTTSQKFYTYTSSLFGQLGFNDFGLHPSFYFGMVILSLGLLSQIKFQPQTKSWLEWWEIIGLIILVLGTYALILTAMFIHATPVENQVIEGVQGRYLLWPYLLTVYLIVRVREILGQPNFSRLMAGTFLISLVINLVWSVLSRYYF